MFHYKKMFILVISVMIGMAPSFVSASTSAEEWVRDLYARVYKDGRLINNMLVEVEVKKCSYPPWSISDWTWSNGIFYENLYGKGIYRAEVTKFLFGTSYGSCPVFFKFDGVQQARVVLNIQRVPFSCSFVERACITNTDEDSINP